MNINATSVGFQPTKAYNTVKFKGIQKAACELANTDTVQKTANKTGFAKISDVAKNACFKAFSTMKKAIATSLKAVSDGVHTIFKTVKSTGKKVADTISGFFKQNRSRIKIKQTNSGTTTTVFQTGKNNVTELNNKALNIAVKDGNVIVNGKIYKYDGELPEGVKISANSFSIKGKNNIKDIINKTNEFAQNVEKNGTLIGTTQA